MKSLLFFGLGVVSGAGIYKLCNIYKNKDKKKGYQEKVYTVARRIPLIIDNNMILEYGISDVGEMFRILDREDNVVVSSGKIVSYQQTEKEFIITFSNGYKLEADEDTIFIIKEKDDIVYESAVNYDDMLETVSKISLNSEVFDKFYDFIESKSRT